MRFARRLTQIIFALFFLYLFIRARYPYEGGIPADLFLRASPLAGLSVMLATRAWVPTVALSLAVLVLTVPLGRFFCGWICPLGTCIDATDRLFRRRGAGSRSRKYRWIKFAVLAVLFTSALFSLQLIWFFDPIALLTRFLATTVYPAVVFLVFAVFDAGFGLGILEDQIYSAYDMAQNTFLPITQPMTFATFSILLITLTIFALGTISRRFWCRNLCPLGALLGLFSIFRLTRREVAESCTQCGLCQRDCKMNAIEDDYSVNNIAECIECAECVAVCPPRSVSYKWGRTRGPIEIDFSRRAFLGAAFTGVAGVTLVKTAAVDRNRSGNMIRPPGALEEDRFLDRCIRCHECVRICASTGACLQPALLQGGWEAFWSPIAVLRSGYCEYSCNLCGQVCPTGAITSLALEKKQRLRMGTAYFDKSRCIPWYSHVDCLVCEEHCPVPEKAIKFDIQQVRTFDGTLKTVMFPYVVEERCIGCGICETKCPVVGKPGIFVTAANEQRISDV